MCTVRAIAVASLLLLSGYGCSEAHKGIAADTPIALLLLDTSGSMERAANCACRTTSCVECLPDCEKGERNRFANLLEVLTGTLDSFRCEPVQRDEAAVGQDAYDFEYFLPYHRPSGQQRNDGLLDEYRDQLRFGLATFDTLDVWVGAPPLVARDEFDFEHSAQQAGTWSYNPENDIPDFVPDSEEPHGSIRYPGTPNTYFMDTGIRNARAESGALRIAIEAARASEVNEKQQRSLLKLRPYGGTPIAAAFDDLYYLLSQDPKLAEVRERGVPVHVVLISDGYPDDDYRTFGCDCSSEQEDCTGPLVPELSQPAVCPYPTPEDAAFVLHCGLGENCAGPAASVRVVQFAAYDPSVIHRANSIAQAGGDPEAHFAQNAVELRAELESIFESILASSEP